MNIVNQIISSYSNNKSLYIGEKVTITEHMIQTAMLAEKNNSSSDLVCSSLLHDYGHFILDNPDDLVKKKKDGKHEDIGYEFLKFSSNHQNNIIFKYLIKPGLWLQNITTSPPDDTQLEVALEALTSAFGDTLDQYRGKEHVADAIG